MLKNRSNTAEATKESKALACRWLVHKAEAHSSKSRLVVDFFSNQTADGRKFRILNIIDEYTRECLASFVARRIRSQDVIFILADLFLKHGVPEHIRSDNVLRSWPKLTFLLKNVRFGYKLIS